MNDLDRDAVRNIFFEFRYVTESAAGALAEFTRTYKAAIDEEFVRLRTTREEGRRQREAQYREWAAVREKRGR